MPEIKLLKRMAGPEGNYSPGFFLEVDADIGQQMVDQGAAEWMPPKRQKPIERAVIAPVEKVVLEVKPSKEIEEDVQEEVKAEEKPKKKAVKKQG